jgi:16S rRNA (guanine(966)-N(2))-methyltransferase RsmD
VPLKTVPDNETRPILDRLKKSLFSILDSSGLLESARVMDLYSGTGTIGIEALSRGAVHTLFVERRRECILLLRENLQKTRLSERAEIAPMLVFQALQARLSQLDDPAKAYDFISYDPPFVFSRDASTRTELESEMRLAARFLKPEGRLMLRTEKCNLPPQPTGLSLVRHWQDGPHAMCFYALGEHAQT